MTELTLEIIKTIAISGTAIVAIVTMIKGYYEYKLSTKQKRIELYEKLGTKLETDKTLKKIIDYLETENPDLKNMSRFDRYKFLRYYEDITLIMNSGLMKPEIAHYMFSYYAIKCDSSSVFWHDINRKAIYWKAFNDFVSQMKEIEQKTLKTSNQKHQNLSI
jgi:hypothetical protein